MTEITDVNELYNHMDIDELFQWIVDYFSEEIIKDILDSEPMYNSINEDIVNKFCKKYIKQAVDSFLKNNNIDVKCAEQLYDKVCREYSESQYGAGIVNELKRKLRPPATFSLALINTDDNIGDVTYLRDEIDFGNRDGNFIIIGDKLITGNYNAIHSELINEYIEKYLHNDTNKDLNDYMVRDLEEFDGLSNDEPVVFGHIVSNMAFIETCKGYTVNEAVNILKNQGSFKKIYDYNHDNDEVTRLAKKVIQIGNRYT